MNRKLKAVITTLPHKKLCSKLKKIMLGRSMEVTLETKYGLCFKCGYVQRD
jgi:hypothetical protein